jgi:hypothetical protein
MGYKALPSLCRTFVKALKMRGHFLTDTKRCDYGALKGKKAR